MVDGCELVGREVASDVVLGVACNVWVCGRLGLGAIMAVFGRQLRSRGRCPVEVNESVDPIQGRAAFCA